MGDARETEKAPDAFRTISEVADDLELPQHVLRFWESRFSQIKPVKRAGGRRFYRPEDVDLLRGIRHLLYTDGFTIKGAQRILKDQGVRYVQDLGIEREVASMRSARPARTAGGDGVTFGGLLGLLPRRRGKGSGAGRAGEEDILPDLPESAELPLPFPDPEADRDLAAEPTSPPMPLRETRDRGPRPERRDPGLEPLPLATSVPEAAPRERLAPAGERREPSFGPAEARARDPGPRPKGNDHTNDDRRHLRPEPRPEHPADPWGHTEPDDHMATDGLRRDDLRPIAQAAPEARFERPPRRGAPEARNAPEERGRERMKPVLRPIQRPTRGPASRLASQAGDAPPHSPELDDPLLPFLDDFSPSPQVSEPIEDRIRRLKAQDRRPLRPHEVQDPHGGDPDARDMDTHGPARARAYREDDYGDEAGAPSASDRAGRRHSFPSEPEDEPGPDSDVVPHHARRGAPGTRDWMAAAPPRPMPAAARPLLSDGAWRQTDWVETAGFDADAPSPSTPPDEDHDTAGRGHHGGMRARADRDHDEEDWPRSRPVPDDEWSEAGGRPAGLSAPYLPAPGAEPEYSMNDEDRPQQRRPSEPPRRPESHPGAPRHAPARSHDVRMRQEPPGHDPAARGAAVGSFPAGAFSAHEPAGHFRQEPGMGGPAAETRHPAEPRLQLRVSPAAGSHDREAPVRTPRGQAGWTGEAMRRAIDEEWGEGAPQALPRATRVGPLIGPISEEGEDGFPMPEAEQRRLAERMSLRGMGPHPAAEPEPVAPARRAAERSRPGPYREEVAADRPQPEDSSRMPREPLRPGPPEQYLPPHLRSEPRVVGQPPVAAPVLSRDDVHRMQSALYELGECRRLMEGLVGQRGEGRSGG